MNTILKKFGLTDDFSVTELSCGHINKTYLCKCESGKYILQSLNRDIFPNPEIVAENISVIGKAFEKFGDNSLFIPHYLQCEGKRYIEQNGEIWRIYDYAESNGHYSPFYHGYAVGRFLKVVNSCSVQLKTPLELHNFGDLKLPIRNIHGDTKADNIIFGERLTIIDLDTAMSGYICADFGDMIRSVTAKKFSMADIRDAVNGFAQGIDGLLTCEEIHSLYNGIVLIISELASRYKGGTGNFPNKTAEQCRLRELELTAQLEQIKGCEMEIRQAVNDGFKNFNPKHLLHFRDAFTELS